MKQFKATQNTPQYGPQSLVMRFIGKFIFIKGAKNSTDYVNKLIVDFEQKGASIIRGNGGWLKIDIIRNNKTVKLGDVSFEQSEVTSKQMEEILYDFFARKYTEAKFLVQEIVE